MNHRMHVMATVAAALMATSPATATAQAAEDFTWQGRLAQGQTVEIRGVNGDVRGVATADDRVRVRAERSARRSDPSTVRIEVVEHAGGVTICAVYPTPSRARSPNECRPGGGQNSVRENDTRVDFLVEVPAGILFEGVSVNGDIVAEGIRADVRGSTVNGSVDLETTGFAAAKTVNGDISCRLGTTRMAGAVEFETVNGSILIEMPQGLNAQLSASTVNGSIDSDFPITVTGRIDRRTLRGTIGAGGPELRLSTVNGGIELREI